MTAGDMAQLEDRVTRQIEKIAADVRTSASEADARQRRTEERLTRIEVVVDERGTNQSVSLVSAERYEEHRAALLRWQEKHEARARETKASVDELRRFMYIATGGLSGAVALLGALSKMGVL